MKKLISLALGVAVAAISFGAPITLNTGSAAWQVATTGVGLGPVTPLNAAQANPGNWVAAPGGASWISATYLAVNPSSNALLQGTPCGVAGTAGTNCAYNLFTAGGDTYHYNLVIPNSVLLANTASGGGAATFQFTGDDYASVFVGNQLGVTYAGGPGALSSVKTINYTVADLNVNGDLVIDAYAYNNPAAGNGNPTGFLLAGNISGVPEPATFGLIALAGLAGIAARRKMVR